MPDGLLPCHTLFDVLTRFSPNFVRDFLRKDVAIDYSPQDRRPVLSVFLRYLPELNRSAEIKVLALQLLIMLTLAATYENSKEAIIHGLMRDALDPNRYDSTRVDGE